MWSKIIIEFTCGWENMDCCMGTEEIISAMLEAESRGKTPFVLAESKPYEKRLTVQEAVDLMRANDCERGNVYCHGGYAHITVDLLWKVRQL